MTTANVPDITSINLLSDDSDDSEQGPSEKAPDIAQKSRNIAVKKGAPVPQPQLQKTVVKVKTGKGMLEGSQFLADFNPENSRREKNKRYNLVKPTKPMKPRGQQSLYDERGFLRASLKDLCDCFDLDCTGCHFACEQCGSQKCGVRCRVNRRWATEVIEHDGKDQVKTNPILTTVNYRN